MGYDYLYCLPQVFVALTRYRPIRVQRSPVASLTPLNAYDTTELEPREILRIYKEQQSTERGFRFIKDPLFFADSLFVKNPERVETMMMLMALCLLVYNLGQRQLRISLNHRKGTVKNQLNQPTESPTLRWIFQCFQGIHVLIIQGFQRILNLTESHCHILQFLPIACQKYYLLSYILRFYLLVFSSIIKNLKLFFFSK